VPQLKPTKIGDVLVLRTRQSYTIYAVGAVARLGQQDFKEQAGVMHVPTHKEAVQAAKSLLGPEGRIYLLDIDTAEWSEIAVV
jgi:hypothetical protein